VRRFNSEIRRTYARTPTELRRRARKLDTDADCYRFRLAFRPPYDWRAMLAFLAAHATPGVETVGESYRRTIALDGHVGTIEVRLAAIADRTSKTRRPDPARIAVRGRQRRESRGAASVAPRVVEAVALGAVVESDALPTAALELEVRFPDARALLAIVERVRRMFDLGADPGVIEQHLGEDPLLRGAIAAHAGLRIPGAWDAFELAVRALIGRRAVARLVERFGTRSDAGLVFPAPARLATARIEAAGVPAARAAVVRALARRLSNIAVTPDSVAAALAETGVDDWTRSYVAMRALGEPDAFPADRALRKLAGRAERWRPWRAYAAMLLWSVR
jgi:AraC family transcriptional regulator of adaptative response / DNA-3-methyladenine glycosylase II